MYITETDKITARIHRVDPTLVAGLLAQGSVAGQPTAVSPRVSLSHRTTGVPTTIVSPFAGVDISRGGSVTIEAWVNVSLDRGVARPIITCGNTSGTGPLLHLFAPGAHAASSAITMLFRDTASGRPVSILSQNLSTLSSLAAVATAPSSMHHIVVVIDGQAQIASFAVDGVVLDGGTELGTGFVELAVLLQQQAHSWSFSTSDSNKPRAHAQQECVVGSSVQTLRVYASDNAAGAPRGYLRTSEIVASYRAGP